MNFAEELLNFKGKVAVITGGASGMGKGIATRFAQAGADVAFTYHKHEEDAEPVAEELRKFGGRVMHVHLDQSNVAECKTAMEQIAKEFGRIDILVNNSGLHGNTPTMELDEESWDTMMDCNLRGAFFCAKAAAEQMISQGTGGSIVSISTINSINPLDNALHYGAAKSGLNMVTRSLAKELGPKGIRVNAIAPGLIDSPMLEVFVPGWRDRFIQRAPLGKPGQPEDIGNICLFLASDMSGWVTGQLIIADGGVTLAPCY